jgi:hypothetical protein
MSWPQLPYETVQQSNAQSQLMCDFVNENPELIDLIHQLLKIYSCGYDPYDPNNKLNKLINRYSPSNETVADLCQRNPDMCDLLKITSRENCKSSQVVFN